MIDASRPWVSNRRAAAPPWVGRIVRFNRITMRRGFTILEVLIAIALILTLIGTMYGFLFDMLNSRSRVLEHVSQETAATTLIRQIDADLMTCIAGDRVNGAGIRGDQRQLRIVSRGVAAHLAARGIDDPDLFSDLQFAEYRHNAQANRIEGRRGSLGSPVQNDPPFTALEGAIHHLRFRYLDGEHWLDEFDSLARNRLPIAIEIAIWTDPFPGQSPNGPDATTDEPIEDAALDSADLETALVIEDASEPVDMPKPDRVRVIVVPDAKAAQVEEALDA